MKHHFIDRFSYKDGILQRIKVSKKFIILIFLLFLILILPQNFIFYFPFFFLILIFLLISKIPLIYFFKRIILILPFLTVIFMLSILSNKSHIIFLYSLLKSLISISLIIIFLFTTKMEEFFKIFEKIPYGNLFSLLFSFLYRYFFLLQDEMERMKRAMISKGKTPDFRTYSILSGNIFIRTYERSERVLKAMISKGWKIERLK